MGRLSTYKTKHSKDFQFQDRVIKQFIDISGTLCLVHKYVGPYKQDPKDSSLFLPDDETALNELSIQDVLLGENRDRKYSDELYELKGVYSVTDNDYDLSQFGYLLSGDTIVLEWHINNLIESIGRKLMTGDVIELVHLRDDSSLDEDSAVLKKYYVVQDANRASTGYGPTWLPHIWRTRCTPIVDTQEYRDILHNDERNMKDETIDWLTDFAQYGPSDSGVTDHTRNGSETASDDQSILNTVNKQIELIKEHQRQEVEKRAFDVHHLYIKINDEQSKTGLLSYVLNGQGTPPNHDGSIIYSGNRFPLDAEENDYFVRSDYEPPRLFRKIGTSWHKVSDVWRRDWVPAHRILESFINNDNITSVGYHYDDTFDERQAISEVILPKAKQPPIEPEDD